MAQSQARCTSRKQIMSVLNNSIIRLNPIRLPREWAHGRARKSPFFLLLILSAALLTGLILLVPAYLLLRAISAGQTTLDTLVSPRTWAILGNTLLLAGSVTLAGTAVALPLAWLTTMTDLPGKRLWAVLAALPLVLPSYVAAFVYVSILTPKGLLQQILHPLTGIERLPSPFGFAGAFFVLTLISYPYVFLTARAALKRMDPSLAEAARSLGASPWSAFWRVTLPYLRPSLIAGGLLVALYVLRDFGAVTMLQYSTFTRILYNRYQAYQLDTAAVLALVLVAVTAVILTLEQRSRGNNRYARLSSGAARQHPITRLGVWKAPALAFVGSVVFFSLMVPVAGLAYWFWRGWNQDFAVRDLTAPQNNLHSMSSLLQPAFNSLSASLLGALLAITLALPVAIISTGFAQEVGRRDFVVTWSLMSRIPLLAELEAADIERLMPMLHAHNMPPNVEIIGEGAPGSAMFFIASGRVRMSTPERTASFQTGEFFGMVAMLENDLSRASFITSSKCRLLKLYREDFHRLEVVAPTVAAHIRKVADTRKQARDTRTGETAGPASHSSQGLE